MAPRVSKVHKYTPEEFEDELCDTIHDDAATVFGQDAFSWQLDAVALIMCGQDVVIDVGTGCGKSLCFSLCLLSNPEDICIVVSPLSALMID